MGKYPKKKTTSETGEEQADLAGMMRAMQQQLTYLERKIDTLLQQGGGRPERGRGFDRGGKPHRKEGRSPRPGFRGSDKVRRSGGDFRKPGKENRNVDASEPGVFIRRSTPREHFGNGRNKQRSFRGDRE